MRPDYFAVPDPLDPAKLCYWYRPKRGKKEGRLEKWPPRRSDWGVLYRKDVLAQPPEERVDYQVVHWQKVRAARQEIAKAIEGDPALAAARFAAARSACCFCGRELTDERSKTYGVGPDCRSGLKPEVLTELVGAMRRAHAAGRISWRQNTHDDPELFS